MKGALLDDLSSRDFADAQRLQVLLSAMRRSAEHGPRRWLCLYGNVHGRTMEAAARKVMALDAKDGRESPYVRALLGETYASGVYDRGESCDDLLARGATTFGFQQVKTTVAQLHQDALMRATPGRRKRLLRRISRAEIDALTPELRRRLGGCMSRAR